MRIASLGFREPPEIVRNLLRAVQSDEEEADSLVAKQNDSDDELVEYGMQKKHLDQVKKLGFERNLNLSSSTVDNMNPRFQKATKTAIRVATWTFICGVGVWILRKSEALPEPYVVGLQGLIVAIIFNVTPKLAATIKASVQAIFGTLIAVVIAWLLYHLPDPHNPSLTPPQVAPTCSADPSEFTAFYCEDQAMVVLTNLIPCLSSFIAFLVYAISVPLILGLNVVMPCKTFALLNLTTFLMNFANPYTSIEGYMELKWTSSVAVILVCQIVGSCLGILAMMIPPIMAAHTAKTLAARVTRSSVKLLVTVNQYYTGSDRTLEINVWNSELARNKEDLDFEKTDLEDAWWEHFNWGRHGRVRTLMLAHLDMLKDLARRMTVLQYCVLNEGFDATHKKAMTLMQEPLKQLVRCIGNLLLHYTVVASDGDIQEAEKQRLIEDRALLKEAMLKVGTTWQIARKDNPLAPELQQENFYVLELCTMGRMLCDFGEKKIPATKNVGFNAIKNMFSIEKYKDKAYRHFIIRTYICLMIAWCWSSSLDHFSPGMPTNVVFMMSVVPGNALIQNLSKLQASVLGSLAGFTLYRIFHFCDPLHKLGKLSSLFFFIFGSMFISNYSAEFETVGVLLAVYAGSKLIQPCKEELTELDLMSLQATEFKGMKTFVFSMLIVTFVDLIMREEPAFKKANEKLLEAIDIVSDFLSSWVNNSMDDDHSDSIAKMSEEVRNDYKKLIWQLTTEVSDKVEACLDEASKLAEAANQEPRFSKGPFKHELFQELVKRVLGLQLNIQVLVRRSKGSLTEQLLPQYIAKCKSWTRVRDDLIDTLDSTKVIVKEVLLHDGFGAMKYKEKGHERFRNLLTKRDVDKLDALSSLAREIAGILPPSDDKDAMNMENDEYCRISVIFAMLNKLIKDMSDICQLTVKSM